VLSLAYVVLMENVVFADIYLLTYMLLLCFVLVRVLVVMFALALFVVVMAADARRARQ